MSEPVCPRCGRVLRRWWPNPLNVVNLWRCPGRRCQYLDCVDTMGGEE